MEWYDLSYDSGRNAKGTMHYNPVAEKYKIILHTKHLALTDFRNFMAQIRNLGLYTVEFLSPFDGQYHTIQCYRGDRKSTMKWNRKDVGILMKPTDLSLIEL